MNTLGERNIGLVCIYLFVAATEIRVGCGTSCRNGRSRRAILHRHDNYAASIRKSGPEIKNRCTKEGENGEKLTSIRKSGPEIRNRCSGGAVPEGFLAAITKFTP